MKAEKMYHIELTEKERYRLFFLTELIEKNDLKILCEKKSNLYSVESLIEIIDDLHEALK